MRKLISLSLVAAALTGCGIPETMDAVRGTPDKMKEMTDRMDSVNEATRMQKVGIALEQLQKKENGTTLAPVPAGLIPWAKVFADSAKPNEIVELFYLWTKKVNEEIYPEGPTRNSAYVADVNQAKLQLIYAMMSIAGQLSDETVENISDLYVTGQGEETRFRSTAYSLMLMRVQFLRDVFLEASLLSESLDSAGKIEKAVRYANQMHKILLKPYAGSLKVKFNGLMAVPGEPAPDAIEESLTKDSARALAIATWTKILEKGREQMRATQDDLTGNAGQNTALARAEQRRADAAFALIEGKLKALTTPAP